MIALNFYLMTLEGVNSDFDKTMIKRYFLLCRLSLPFPNVLEILLEISTSDCLILG